MLAKDVADRPQSLETVRKISGGVKRLESLVSQVLQFNAADSGSSPACGYRAACGAGWLNMRRRRLADMKVDCQRQRAIFPRHVGGSNPTRASDLESAAQCCRGNGAGRSSEHCIRFIDR